ncbi:M48 family metallopeptidase [Leadbettera azotonutricia]|nr:M48 family metallopeptidase [Leadbettera azotonutricia]
MKKIVVLLTAIIIAIIAVACATNPLTGKTTMAFVDNSQLFPSSFQQYDEVLNESQVVTGTAAALMVDRVGARLKEAAEKWLASEGQSSYLAGYAWEYHLVQDDQVNAWCMPGGKIVVYTGILPVTKDETGLAVVLGHEISHALLNHGQQRMSADVLSQLGASGLNIVTGGRSPETQALAMTAYGVGSQLFGTLPFSRKHESEADHYGLLLMAIAGYSPDAAVPFWERMAAMGGGGTPEFLSTHPSDATRINQLRDWIPEAKSKAAQFGVNY